MKEIEYVLKLENRIDFFLYSLVFRLNFYKEVICVFNLIDRYCFYFF